MRCHQLLIGVIVNHTPDIVYTCRELLLDASSRKHPTQPQLKLLREKLPELQVLPHLISSSIFRQELIDAEFLSGIASLAQCGVETKLASGLGELLWRNFLDAIVSVLEVVCARPELLATHADILVTHSYPLLIHVLITDKQSGSKLLYIKLINDLLEVAIPP